MALLITLLVLLAATAGLLPFAFRLVGKLIGRNIRSRTQYKREILLSRALAEAANQAAGQEGTPSKPASSSTSLDSDWEQVHDGGEKTPTGQRTTAPGDSYDGVIGFFHPFCNAGGGGERVLFAAVLATQQRYPKALCVVYTGDDARKEEIIENVMKRFNINLNPARIAFVYPTTRDWVLASRWPHFTLLGQSVGSLILGWDSFNTLVPDVFVDTMGYAFVLALSKWLFPHVPTGAYVHFPTISTDMLRSLHDEAGSGGVNAGTGKGAKGKVKEIYWELFAKLYCWVGGSVDVVMTNSSWTQRHISSLWGPSRTNRKKQHKIEVVYPPCPVEELHEKIPVDCDKQRTNNILYIAQFRPEKMHQTIIEAFHTFLRNHHRNTPVESRPKLVLVGSVRDDSDEKRVYKLRLQAQEIKDSVIFHVNAKWTQMVEEEKTCSVGVNGMWNEHFGIGVVEYQAAGLISVVNNSGGPKEDIVIPIDGKPTGFHASTPSEFAEGFAQALSLSEEEALAMRQRARKSSWRFSEKVFRDAWLSQLENLLSLVRDRDKQ
ncbi:glycosyltransferase family 4 [Lecanosticta acicola]|uniref:GDP-Man:Man(3)GlcNAc(2)-PP-Dol alpha-1,2-mannosyltransferase n=1 Tax=Lecanosticta acicola TaxID=111012 RepID=A0AAI8YZZ7_9PEZI|nr:glycosyltransferase family 4 [Lecanosticta acicola]